MSYFHSFTCVKQRFNNHRTFNHCFFLSRFQFSDDEEDTKRVVKSAKEKRYESLYTIIKTIRNSKKINDFNKMETSFMELCKAYEKAKPVILKEEPNGETPKFYIRILVEMEDLINKTWEDKDLRKNMNKNNSKSLGALRQKLRKYIRTDFEDSVAKFRENPDEGEEEEQEEEKEPESAGESDDEDAVPVAKVKVQHLLVFTFRSLALVRN